MTTLFDSTDPTQIPNGAPAVAGYVDGRYAWSQAAWAAFPAAEKVTITVLGTHGARVADVELGDLTAGQGAAWAVGELWSLRRPTLYASRDTWPAIVTALGGLGVSTSEVDWWAADPTGVPHLVPGSVATQWAWHSLGQTGAANVDISMTGPGWPSSLVPVPSRAPTVAIVDYPAGDGYWEVGSDGGVFAYGAAPFLGSLGGLVLTAPIASATATPDGRGYRLAGADGAVYCFGTATYHGGSNA